MQYTTVSLSFALMLGLSISFVAIRPAYAEFDSGGNYVCNPFKKSLETNIYINTVEQINYQVALYSKSYPTATLQQTHDFITADQNTWSVYLKSRECITALGIDPDKVAPQSPLVQEAVAVPEFGLLAPLVVTVGIVGSIVILRKFTPLKW